MKKVFLIVFVFILSFSLVIQPEQTYANQIFSDVPTTHSNYGDILYLLKQGVVIESSEYGISDIVTREEVAVMIAKAVGLDGAPRETIFNDVPASNLNSGYIQSAVDAGIINGYLDGTFKPDAKVTRGHMAAFIARAFELPNGNKTFKDVPSNNTAYEAVKQLAAAGITTGYEDGTFRPSNNLTRGHISSFLARAMRYEDKENSQKNITEDGYVIEDGYAKIMILETKFSEEVHPTNEDPNANFLNASSWYEPSKEGAVLLDVITNLTNLQSSEARVDSFVNMELLYNNEETFESTPYAAVEDLKGEKFYYTDRTYIEPEETNTLHFIFQVPESIEDENTSLILEFTLNQKFYRYEIR